MQSLASSWTSWWLPWRGIVLTLARSHCGGSTRSISHSEGDQKRTWETIFFDDSLRYLEGFEGAATAARVVWAIEEWARVKAQTPKGEKSLDPLPREELIAFLERCGEAARPALEASLAKKHGARSVIELALERIGPAKA